MDYEDLLRRAREVRNESAHAEDREQELDEEATRVGVEVGDLEMNQIPALEREIVELRSVCNVLERESAMSLNTAEECRVAAGQLERDFSMLKQEAHEKNVRAEKMRGRAGHLCHRGVERRRIGHHREAAPFLEEAVDLAVGAQKLDLEAEEENRQASTTIQNSGLLVNHAIAHATYRDEVRQQIGEYCRRMHEAERSLSEKQDLWRVKWGEMRRLRDEGGQFGQLAFKKLEEAADYEAAAAALKKQK